MVLHVIKWNIRPDQKEAYTEWAKTAIQRTVGAPGVVEFRAYRPVTGAAQVVVTYEFDDLVAWAKWNSHETVQQVFNEARGFTTDLTVEVWGPSPVVPRPVRPGS